MESSASSHAYLSDWTASKSMRSVKTNKALPSPGSVLNDVYLYLTKEFVLLPDEVLPLRFEKQHQKDALNDIIQFSESSGCNNSGRSNSSFSYLSILYLGRDSHNSLEDINREIEKKDLAFKASSPPNQVLELDISKVEVFKEDIEEQLKQQEEWEMEQKRQQNLWPDTFGNNTGNYNGYIGTLTQILECPVHSDNNSNDNNTNGSNNNTGDMCLTVKGLCRFQLLSGISVRTNDGQGVIRATVKLLPDLISKERIPPSLDMTAHTLKKHYNNHFYHKQVDPEYLAQKAWDKFYELYYASRGVLKSEVPWGPAISTSESDSAICVYQASHSPIGFSWHLSKNLVIDNEMKQTLLRSENVIYRLRQCISLIDRQLENEATLVCNSRYCNHVNQNRNGHEDGNERNSFTFICQQQEIFTVPGAEGQVGSYVNPHGAVHQTVTVRKINERSIRLHGQPTVADSWFPGYAWTIISCVVCHGHLGWKFTKCGNSTTTSTTANDEDRVDEVLEFYGLVKEGIKQGAPAGRIASPRSFGDHMQAMLEATLAGTVAGNNTDAEANEPPSVERLMRLLSNGLQYPLTLDDLDNEWDEMDMSDYGDAEEEEEEEMSLDGVVESIDDDIGSAEDTEEEEEEEEEEKGNLYDSLGSRH
jgi:hypothetical protein